MRATQERYEISPIPEKSPGKILSIQQPFAELIVSGKKRCENRGWKTGFRGLLWIHAGMNESRLSRNAFRTYPEMKLGGIVGAVRLVDCLEYDRVFAKHPLLASHQHVEGPDCWIFEEAVRIPFYPLRGKQGIWTDADVYSNCWIHLPKAWVDHA